MRPFRRRRARCPECGHPAPAVINVSLSNAQVADLAERLGGRLLQHVRIEPNDAGT